MSGERAPDGWYAPVARHLKGAYLRYEFTFGTVQEVDFLMSRLPLKEGSRVLDVGCGPGRHAVELARRGVDVVGVDISADFIALARRSAAEAMVALSLYEMDAADMPFEDEFDAVISICEGGFGLGLDDLRILRRMGAAARPGGAVVAAGGNLLHLIERGPGGGELDPQTLVFKEVRPAVPGDGGQEKSFAMWASMFTPREMEWIANGAGLDPVAVYGVAPGEFAAEAPSAKHPELLLVAQKPHAAP